MMTIAQKKYVLNFLISKKLPVDLITELNDHFNEQITEQINKNNLTFEEGFLRVKLIWEDDFKLEKSGS